MWGPWDGTGSTGNRKSAWGASATGTHASLNGLANFAEISGLFAVNASRILFGLLHERYATPGDGDLLPFIFGSMVGIVPWIIIAINLIGTGNTSDVTVPGFVWGIIGSLFVFFNRFAVVQWLQYRAKGKWANHLRGECAYIVQSLVAKTALAWQVFSGVLAS